MNDKSLQILEKFLPKSYIQQASEAKKIHENEIRILLEKVFYLSNKYSSLKKIKKLFKV
jgi:hypothetical protein